ncbi:adenosylcobinamide-GDP ribazoletransferase [Methanocaldococcus indicus]|uniref:adenosylcobinamide-GDP ribazoletransferase n=1 Tax=Methanocaldococcus indicus TaxID=213231 RepID=UPI003C6CF305
MRIIKLFFSFFTRIPINVENFSLEDIGKNFHLVIFIGYFFGVIGYIFVKLLCIYPLLSSTITIFIIEYLNSFQHFDGLLDFGDAWMSFNNKLDALKDKYIGVGGFAFGFFITLISIISYSYFITNSLIYYIFIIEVLNKLSMISCATFGNPQPSGSGRYIVKNCSLKNLMYGLILVLPLILINKEVIFLIICSVIVGYILSRYANKNLSGVNGDILGASNEINRAVISFLIIFSNNIYIDVLTFFNSF